MDTEAFRPTGDTRRNRICFVGRLAEQKNVGALLDAVSGLDVELLVIGDGPLRPALEARARAQDATARFLGVVPHRDLPAIMAGSSLFVLPSLYEGHPKTLIEAMACGVAVIGTDVPGIRDLLRHEETGYLCRPTAASTA